MTNAMISVSGWLGPSPFVIKTSESNQQLSSPLSFDIRFMILVEGWHSPLLPWSLNRRHPWRETMNQGVPLREKYSAGICTFKSIAPTLNIKLLLQYHLKPKTILSAVHLPRDLFTGGGWAVIWPGSLLHHKPKRNVGKNLIANNSDKKNPETGSGECVERCRGAQPIFSEQNSPNSVC